jgi:hypothetical protein
VGQKLSARTQQVKRLVPESAGYGPCPYRTTGRRIVGENIDNRAGLPNDPSLTIQWVTSISTDLTPNGATVWPAPLFDNVKEAMPGVRLLGAAGALSSDRRYPPARVLFSLSLSHDVTAQELVEHLVAAHGSAPIPPKLISADSAPETSLEPAYTIEAITYRNQPIWPVSATARSMIRRSPRRSGYRLRWLRCCATRACPSPRPGCWWIPPAIG